MNKEKRIANTKKRYFNNLLNARMSVDDLMPLYTKAQAIFELCSKKKKVVRTS